MIAEGLVEGGSNGVIGEFKADLRFEYMPNQRLGVVEVFEESASDSGEDLHLDRGSRSSCGRKGNRRASRHSGKKGD